MAAPRGRIHGVHGFGCGGLSGSLRLDCSAHGLKARRRRLRWDAKFPRIVGAEKECHPHALSRRPSYSQPICLTARPSRVEIRLHTSKKLGETIPTSIFRCRRRDVEFFFRPSSRRVATSLCAAVPPVRHLYLFRRRERPRLFPKLFPFCVVIIVVNHGSAPLRPVWTLHPAPKLLPQYRRSNQATDRR